MPVKVHLNRLASKDIRELFGYVKVRSGTASAKKWADGLLARIDSLDTSPEVWPLSEIPELADFGVRELLYRRSRFVYRIFFRIAGDEVFVHRIRSASQGDLSADQL
jgi:plasmid stabilization system protein ParE